MKQASFQANVTAEDCMRFAQMFGDWNPLHTDSAYAAATRFQKPILHGAFSAGLISRLAGMQLPGRDCLLHGMRLRFVAPIFPPAALVVQGREERSDNLSTRVVVTINDATSGTRYVEASYDYSRHETAHVDETPIRTQVGEPCVLVTGASGALGGAVLRALGSQGRALARSPGGYTAAAKAAGRIDAIVHCAWPAPDNEQLSSLTKPEAVIDHHVAAPLRDLLALARLLRERGSDNALLILVGSTAAVPGRHGYRAPLYSLAKSMIPTVCRILAVELGGLGRRCVAIVYDAIDGGMNRSISPALRLAHADRVPHGHLPTPDDAAAQIVWLLQNATPFVSGATIEVSGGALP